jgi:DNA-binding response OmpR family regulator
MRNYDLSALKVLVVQDARFMQEILRTVLLGLGIKEQMVCATAEAAWPALAEFAPDLVLVDWDLPPQDGTALARRIRRAPNAPNPFVPIIMISGHGERDRAMAVRNAGVNELLVKPVSPRALYERIVAVIEDSRPFIRCPSYVGPERRRRDDRNYAGPERRAGRDRRLSRVQADELARVTAGLAEVEA